MVQLGHLPHVLTNSVYLLMMSMLPLNLQKCAAVKAMIQSYSVRTLLVMDVQVIESDCFHHMMKSLHILRDGTSGHQLQQ
jgi:hypothetical protein